MYPTTQELFESFSRHRPEGKLELIEGRLIVGNTIVGSRLLLQQILQGWKADAAVAFASIDTWIEALQIELDLSCSVERRGIADALDVLEATIAEIEYHLQLVRAELQKNWVEGLLESAKEVRIG